MLEVFSAEQRLRRSLYTRLAIAAVCLPVIVALGFYFTEWPWFSIDAAILLTCAAAIALPRSRAILWPGAPWVPWTALSILTCLFVVHSYYIELLHQRSDRFDVVGVRLPLPPDSTFTVGADNSADIRLQVPSDSLTHWNLKLRKVADGFSIVDAYGVDAIQQAEARSWSRRFVDMLTNGSNREWPHKIGSTFGTGSAPVRVASRTNQALNYRFEVQTLKGIPVLFWNRDSTLLQLKETGDPATEVHNTRLLRRLRSGVRLAELKWSHVPDASAAQNLVLSAAHIPQAKLRRVPLLNQYRFQLTSRSADWRVGTSTQRVSPQLLTPNDSIQVSANGYRWVFSVDIAHLSGFGKGQVDLSFGRAPSPRLGWLPAAGTCRPATRCTLISNRHLPPAIPYFDISEFGLDSTRYGFLARVSLVGNTVNIVTPTKAYTAEGDTVISIPVQPKQAGDQASYQVRVYRVAKGGFRSLLITLAGVIWLVAGVASLPWVRLRLGSLLRQDTIAANAAWAIASISVVLLGIRLALGYRITYAAPYAARGADTAVGMLVTIILLTALLVSWAEWAPWLIRALLSLERTTSAQTALVLTPRDQTRISATGIATGATSIRSRLTKLGIAFIGLLIVASQRPDAVARSCLIVVLVLSCWVVIEYLGSQETTNIALSAGEVLGLEEADRDWGRWAALMLVTIGIPASVLARGRAFAFAFVITGIFFLILIAIAATRIWRRLFRNGTREPSAVRVGWISRFTSLPPGRWGALLVVTMFLFGFNLLLLWFEGPVLLFIGVFFLFLLAIRLGHHIRFTMYRKEWLRTLGGVGVLVAALLLALPVDFGLMLVLGFPLAVAFVVTLNPPRNSKWIVAGSVVVVGVCLYFFVRPVLFPPASAIDRKQSAAETSLAFNQLGGPLKELGFAELPVRRSVVRAMAARNPELLELVLSRAAPSPTREQVIPAMEQIWGGRAYAASGLTGKGLARQTAIGRGVPTVVSYAENTFSVYILAEHGFLGGLVVLLCYLLLLGAAFGFMWNVAAAERHVPKPNTTAVAVTVGGVMMLTIPALYVAAANIGVVPLTGQNMPFLGLNAWSDVAFVGALLSAIFAVLLDTAVLDRSDG